MIGSILFLTASFGPFLRYEIEYRLFVLSGKKYAIDSTNGTTNTGLIQAIFSHSETIFIKPIDSNFDIIIPKIGLNERIIDNVDSNNVQAVEDSLKIGVGRARGTAYPDQYGNMYLFAHSSTNVLSIDRYNAVFTLLRDMKDGDLVYVFYKGKEYTYQIYTQIIVSPNDTKDITFNAPYPQITLQTCDPPGFDINRLLLKAKLI